MSGWRSSKGRGLSRSRSGGGEVSGGIVILLVLGTIAIARARFGDASYEKIVITIFKWWFGLALIFFVAVVFYNRFLK